ncbi:acetyltransferase [Ilyonectria robusta]
MARSPNDDAGDSLPQGSAPDLQILGDEVTLQPSGYVEPPAREAPEEKEEALMDKFASFRAEPFQ